MKQVVSSEGQSQMLRVHFLIRWFQPLMQIRIAWGSLKMYTTCFVHEHFSDM